MECHQIEWTVENVADVVVIFAVPHRPDGPSALCVSFHNGNVRALLVPVDIPPRPGIFSFVSVNSGDHHVGEWKIIATGEINLTVFDLDCLIDRKVTVVNMLSPVGLCFGVCGGMQCDGIAAFAEELCRFPYPHL